MYKVAVLLSAYNGTKYLKEQIDSILGQVDVELTLIIRNDGSKDNTIELLNEYKDNHNNVIVLDEENCGLAKSFMNLVYYAKSDYDYYVLADQDDVWLNNKIISGIKMIENDNIPVLYSSNQNLVDQDLNPLGIRYKEPIDTSYKQIISNNLISGCTFVWNKKLQEILIDENRKPSDELLAKRIHDVWIAGVASVTGKIVFDMNAYIEYRQHQNNVVGVRKNSKIKSFIKKFKDPSKRCGRSQLASELYTKFNDLIISSDIKEELNILGNYKENKKLKKELLKKIDYRKYNNESKFEFRFKVKRNLF